MPGRQFSLSSYRFGFNGKEEDDEVKGDGNQQDYGMRIYDPRLGRFLSIDPLTSKYAFYSPYQFAGNKPIRFIDKDGKEEDSPDPYNLNAIPTIFKNFEVATRAMSASARVHLGSDLWYALDWAADFRMWGRSLSSRNMLRYLEGKGGYDIYSYSSLVGNWKFNGANKEVQEKIVSEIGNFAKTIKAPGTYTYCFTVKYGAEQTPSYVAFTDVGSAFGSFQVNATGYFLITLDEKGKYSYIGKIYYTFKDIYRWHDRGKEGSKEDEDLVDHSRLNNLKKVGAKEFGIRSYYSQGVQGEGHKASFGEITDNYSPTSDSKNDNYYALPKESKLVNDFREK